MDGTLVRTFADHWLGLDLNEVEADALVQPLAGMAKLVRTIEQVSLPYSGDPFISPGIGDQWLDTWPDR